MEDKDKQVKQNCCGVHPMYDTVICENESGHIGLHKGYYQGEFLRWGIPSHDEMYNAKRTKG